MATVLVGAYAQNPAHLWPNVYASCVWNFVTGWTCQTVDPVTTEPVSAPDPLNVDMPSPLPVSSVSGALPNDSGRDCGCCGGGSVANGLTPSLTGGIAVTATATRKCSCGYTDRQALLAMAVAVGFILLIGKR